MTDFLQTWIPIALSVYSGIYVSYRLLKRDDRKAKIEYWQGVANDLTTRFDKLKLEVVAMEEQLTRYRMMKDYVFEVLGYGDSIVKQAQLILDGEMLYRKRKRDDDITEAHG